MIGIDNVYIILIILGSWACASFMDAIVFGKAYGEATYELWHIIKAICFGIIYGYILYLNNAIWEWYLAVIFLLWIQHEVLYPLFRLADVYRLDNKYRIRFVQWLWKGWW